MAYRLVRTLVYKRGVGIRETVLGWDLVFGNKSNSVAGVGLFLHAEPRRRSVPLHGVLDGGVGSRQRGSLGPCVRDGPSDNHSSSSIYQIPNTEHMAYRLLRTLVYKRGVGIRETGR